LRLKKQTYKTSTRNDFERLKRPKFGSKNQNLAQRPKCSKEFHCQKSFKIKICDKNLTKKISAIENSDQKFDKP
jgi:hypothetical protein